MLAIAERLGMTVRLRLTMPPRLSRKNILPFRMALHLRLCERAQRDDDNPLTSRILHHPENQSFTDLLATQSGGNEGMVYNDAVFACSTVGHLGFVLADRNTISPLRRAIFPLDIDLSFLSLVFHANSSVVFDQVDGWSTVIA